ncbi:hypothetical protein WCE34_14305 [Luteimonas sp. MJ204]|uniref:hypothetical protein n=1 Tax=Luteimonas sp. MJ145 TaxID=3129234 RepID=UPI0031BB8A3C
MLTVVPDKTFDPTLCECCGKTTRGVSGWIEDSDKTLAAYLIHWTQSSKDHDANFDLVFGNWGDLATANDRSVASFAYRPSENSFMVIDSRTRPAGQSNDLASFPLTRDEIVGTPLAPYLFGLLDAIWLQDSRIAVICGDG